MNPPGESGRASRQQQGRATAIIVREAAQFIARESGTESLITVIRAEPDTHGERMMVFVSVFPSEKAREALAFLGRKREAFSKYLKQHTHLRLPRIDFLLDNEQSGGPGGIRTLA